MKFMQRFVENTNFYFSFFEKQLIPSVFDKIAFNNEPLTRIKHWDDNTLPSKIIVLNLFSRIIIIFSKKFVRMVTNKKIVSLLSY